MMKPNEMDRLRARLEARHMRQTLRLEDAHGRRVRALLEIFGRALGSAAGAREIKRARRRQAKRENGE